MSNTYAKIEKEVKHDSFLQFHGYTNKMRLTLTAFVGKEEVVQLTVTTDSTLEGQSGTGYITLTNKEIDDLILALKERREGDISATGYEQSKIIPNDI